MTTTLVEPKQTTVKNGIDTTHYSMINEFEKQYSTSNGHWRKENIDERGKDLAQLMYKILANEIE